MSKAKRSAMRWLALLAGATLLLGGSFVAGVGPAAGDTQLKRSPWRAKPRAPRYRVKRPAEPAVPTPEASPAPEQAPAAVPVPAADAEGSEVAISGDRACGHLEALSEIGPRAAGTQGAARARAYLREQLEAAGVEVQERKLTVARRGAPDVEAVHLIGVLPGESADRVVVAASYDSVASSDADPDASAGGASAGGAALLLELGRWLARQPHPYSVWLVFADGDALPASGEAGAPAFLGSAGLAEQLSRAGELDRIRVAFFFGEVADPGLAVARDLRSNGSYRDILWRAAVAQGHADVFPAESDLSSPAGAHQAFLDRGMRRVVVITGERPSASVDDAPQVGTASPSCSADSLRAVGASSGAALTRIQERLAKIDRFVFIGELDETTAASPAP